MARTTDTAGCPGRARLCCLRRRALAASRGEGEWMSLETLGHLIDGCQESSALLRPRPNRAYWQNESPRLLLWERRYIFIV